ncbi:hypothetical protein M406DRAFT_289588 [Cryphonectria parasitica EP155]|uniref:MYND-type domain-containing protein n=1 Tax=Cryphonectria parasitica (strain ATCC 38755 / EP155) TaxID=660469 RepID=A0A9P5CPW3_CRYP1|nr:uncharacterized protein M406DRAFT_289588 [Cryphonectria parasitica EP155]KAF3765395.1 hypothetical protein M406DRAFT_289588 [Cryphonectria parasitica EP155]
MLTPTTLAPTFNPFGDTPAVDLTRCLPLENDSESADARVDILLLGSRDLRHILHTCYTKRGSPRNVLFLTLLVAKGQTTPSSILWNLFYDLYLGEESVQVLKTHAEELQNISTSLTKWEEGRFGDKVRFGDASTLASVHDIWSAYLDFLRIKDTHEYHANFTRSLDKTKELLKHNNDCGEALKYRGARATAPLGFQSLGDSGLRAALEAWLGTGPLGISIKENKIPNPLFAFSMLGHTLQTANMLPPTTILSPACNPLLGFHLAAAEAQLTETSPLRALNPGHEAQTPESRIISSAQLQFSEWSKALQELSPKHLIVRFISADCLAFCHTLQHQVRTGEATASLYRRQFSPYPLELDTREYVLREAPSRFDVIETGDLSEFSGTLNVLVSAGPLLKDKAWTTLYTEITTDDTGTQLDTLLGGPFRTVSTLLGISPAEYWTNAAAVSHIDAYMLAASAAQAALSVSHIRYHLSWKENRHASGQPPGVRLRVDASSLADLLLLVYEYMLRQHTTPRVYHHGSFTAFMKRLLQCIDTDRQTVCERVLDSISNPELSLALSMQGLYSPVRSEAEKIERNALSTWPSIPEGVYITIAVPADQLKPLEQVDSSRIIPVAVQGCISVQDGDQQPSQSVFDDVQISFGKTESFSEGVESEPLITVWPALGTDMIVSFCVPASALQHDPSRTKVSLRVQSSDSNRKIFRLASDMDNVLEIFSSSLENTSAVYITRHPTRQLDYPVYNSLEPDSRTHSDHQESEPHFSCELDSSGVITAITGHLPITSAKGKQLLAEKAAVETRKMSPCVFQVLLGDRGLVLELNFPAPVVKDGSKTRIARTSGYIEILAPLADPVKSQELDDFIFPTISAEFSGISVPLALNLPLVNLDTLPALDLSKREQLSFLSTLTSSMYSARERKVRDKLQSSSTTHLASSARMNFKESLFSMFMLSSGLQGGQTGLFSLSHPKSGNHILLFVSAIRLDAANANVVIDAAVIPLTEDLISSGVLETFLLILRNLECGSLIVDDAELVLWKKALPAFAERCRTWSHRPSPGCEYMQPGAKIPLSTDPGRPVICNCGVGKLPDSFISLPEWDTASQFATRIAISPFYASYLVEEVIDPKMLKDTVAAATGRGMSVGETPRCRNCGTSEEDKDGVVLKKCVRCLKARYCSVECQKKDWKKHRMECEEVGDRP